MVEMERIINGEDFDSFFGGRSERGKKEGVVCEKGEGELLGVGWLI